MKTSTALVATIFALASLPLLGQQSSPDSQPASPSMQKSSPGSQPEQPASQQPGNPTAQPEQASPNGTSSAGDTQSSAANSSMRPVQGELVSGLDTSTAKTGDNIVVQTKSSVKTIDGIEIPKGSKLVGHVVAVQASSGGTNSQVAVKFDHAEIKGGQNLAIVSEIQSIQPAGSAAAADQPSAMDRPSMSGPAPSGPGSTSSAPGAAPGGSMPSQSSAGQSRTPGYTPEGSGMGNAAPAEGTVVARTGNITIKTTAMPGVLLANNAPGQQDPRMTQASSILLGAKKDVKLDGGTEMVVAVAAAPGDPTQ